MQRKHRYYVDSYGYMLETSRSWGVGDGRGDAVGRTVLSAIIYREQRFIDIIRESFSEFMIHGVWNPVRHIDDPRTGDFSRDHTIWFVIWMKHFYPGAIRRALDIPVRISDKFRLSLDQLFWMRAVALDRWIDRMLYWAIASVMLRFNNALNRLLRQRAGIVSCHYLEFKATPESELTDRELFARKNSAPSYSMDIQAFMIRCLSDGWFKDRLKKRMIPLVERSNYLVRILMDDTLSKDDIIAIMQYSGMDAFRWSRRLDKTTDIDMFPLSGEQPVYNMDVDALVYFHYQ